MASALQKPQLEADLFVPRRDPRTKKIRSVSTLHNLNIGVVEQSANLIVSGESKLLGIARLEGGATGTLNYPDGTLALVAGTGVNLSQRGDGKIVIDAVVDTSDLAADLTSRMAVLEAGAANAIQLFLAFSGSMSGMAPRLVTVESSVNSVTSSLGTTISRIEALESGMESVRARAGGIGAGVEMNAQPAGAIDGSNVIFTLPSAPSPASSLMFFKNGQLLTSGSYADYTLSSATVTLASPPEPDDTLSALFTYQLAVKSYSINEPVTLAVTNGVVTIALLNAPNPPETLMLFMNGQLLAPASDFVLSGSSVTLDSGLRDVEESRFFATYTY
jgi:hypothetical protein